MGFVIAVGTCFRKYFTLSGRASRAEYWWWTLFLTIGGFAYSLAFSASLVPLAEADLESFAVVELIRIIAIGSAFWLLTAIPTLTVTVRRLHDIGRSGGWILMPWLLNGAVLWGALITMPPELSALGLRGVAGDPLLGSLLMLGGSIGALIFSITFLVWMLKAGTRGDNFFGPDPRGGGSAGEDYVQSYMPQVNRKATPAAPAAPQMSHREEISALYQQRVLGKQGQG